MNWQGSKAGTPVSSSLYMKVQRLLTPQVWVLGHLHLHGSTAAPEWQIKLRIVYDRAIIRMVNPVLPVCSHSCGPSSKSSPEHRVTLPAVCPSGLFVQNGEVEYCLWRIYSPTSSFYLRKLNCSKLCFAHLNHKSFTCVENICVCKFPGWKTAGENVGKETGTKFTACSAVTLSMATLSAENMSQRAVPAVSAFPLRVCLVSTKSSVPRRNTYL